MVQAHRGLGILWRMRQFGRRRENQRFGDVEAGVQEQPHGIPGGILPRRPPRRSPRSRPLAPPPPPPASVHRNPGLLMPPPPPPPPRLPSRLPPPRPPAPPHPLNPIASSPIPNATGISNDFYIDDDDLMNSSFRYGFFLQNK